MGLSSLCFNRWITREELVERGFEKLINELDGKTAALQKVGALGCAWWVRSCLYNVLIVKWDAGLRGPPTFPAACQILILPAPCVALVMRRWASRPGR